ncbi:transporter substrate-binding domain-containing protein [Flexivirga oryzae]|uniref:Polar amino acid transport system substrate-binding protein n=1 Tax=Flexivirga oryzae TaxID=1794944 RepID=A0A839N644_9MICO|nr:transporter substrate-binding domain-containing protein [Flexivirga oryzae]MBB2892239.1 polar amino acid transport system substrate-binding protein [Flexivirga oryzae]
MSRTTKGRSTAVGLLSVAAIATATGCASSAASTPTQTTGSGKVVVGALSNGAGREATLTVKPVASIRAQLPAAVRKSGKLVIGEGALPAGFPPLAYVGTDHQTLTGAEPDLGRLVAAVLGLKPEVTNATWENLFVGIDSGKTDVGFSNITDTEERKQKYDFACYRKDNLAFEQLASSDWKFGGDYRNLSGKRVAVGSGTNQEKILLSWQKKLRAAGKKLTIVHYPDQNATNLALASGRIDLYFGPNPGVQYDVTQSAHTNRPTRNAGQWSGAGASLQGLICATSKKGDGLAKPVAAAIDHLIRTGDYGKWLAAWNLSNEAVKTAAINPPGLPLSDS